MCSNSKHSILRETYGKEKIVNKVTSTYKVSGRNAFSLLRLSAGCQPALSWSNQGMSA